MSEMVERVAVAIFAGLRKSDPCGFIAEPDEDGFSAVDGRFNISDVASAAIEAMREPTPTMIRAGDAIDDEGCPNDGDFGRVANAEEHYAVMIAAALIG